MRIAQVAPPSATIALDTAGWRERWIAGLTNALVDRGHTVTLFAGADANVRADVVVCESVPRAIDAVYSGAGRYDIIHALYDSVPADIALACPTPTLTTWLEWPDASLGDPAGLPLVAISDSQPPRLADGDWRATIGPAFDLTPYPYSAIGGVSLLWVSDMPGDGEMARGIASRAGVDIAFAPSADSSARLRLLAGALALLRLSDPDDLYDQIAIEALACGTPVLSIGGRSCEGVVVPGVTGWCADTPDELVALVSEISLISRRSCRMHAERHYSLAVAVARYEAIFSEVAGLLPDPIGLIQLEPPP